MKRVVKGPCNGAQLLHKMLGIIAVQVQERKRCFAKHMCRTCPCERAPCYHRHSSGGVLEPPIYLHAILHSIRKPSLNSIQNTTSTRNISIFRIAPPPWLKSHLTLSMQHHSITRANQHALCREWGGAGRQPSNLSADFPQMSAALSCSSITCVPCLSNLQTF